VLKYNVVLNVRGQTRLQLAPQDGIALLNVAVVIPINLKTCTYNYIGKVKGCGVAEEKWDALKLL
jgi:hypothetical protein